MTIQEPYNIKINPYQSITISHGDAQIDIYKQTQTPKHTLALFSGFAETIETHKLLTDIFAWGLNHKCRVAVVKTFINNLELLEEKNTQNYEYSELQELYDTCMKELLYATQDNKTHIIAHSTPTTPLTLHFNDCIKSGHQPPIGSAILLAPYPTNPDIINTLIKLALRNNDRNMATRLQNIIPFTQKLFNAMHLIEPKLMSKYKFPLYLISGKTDKTAPANNTFTKFVVPAANEYISSIIVPGGHNFNKDLSDLPVKILKQQYEK